MAAVPTAPFPFLAFEARRSAVQRRSPLTTRCSPSLALCYAQLIRSLYLFLTTLFVFNYPYCSYLLTCT